MKHWKMVLVFFALTVLITGCAASATRIEIENVTSRQLTPAEAKEVMASIVEPYHVEVADLNFLSPNPATGTSNFNNVTLPDGSVAEFEEINGMTIVRTLRVNPAGRNPEDILGAHYRDALTHNTSGAVIPITDERQMALSAVEMGANSISVLRDIAKTPDLTAEQRKALGGMFNSQRSIIFQNIDLLTSTASVPTPVSNVAPTPRPSLLKRFTGLKPLGLLGNNVFYLGQYPGKTDVSEWDANAGEFTHYFAESGNGLQWGLYAAQESYDGKNTTNGYLFKGTKNRFALAYRINGDASQTEARFFSERRDDDGHSSTWTEQRTANIMGLRFAHNEFRHDKRWFSEENYWAEWKQQLSGGRDARKKGVPQKLDPVNYSERRLGVATDLIHKRWHDDRMRLALGIVGEESQMREDSSERLLVAGRVRYTYRTTHWTQLMFDVQVGKSFNTNVEDTDVLSVNLSLSF